MASPVEKPERPCTYADYAAWPDGERWELERGQAIAMSPGANSRHQRIQGVIFGRLWSFLAGRPCVPFTAPLDVIFVEEGDAPGAETTVYQPDLVVICDPRRIVKRGVLGAPDLVVEILSPSTASRDQRAKLATYERHGVREYWIVAPESEVLKQYLLAADGKYPPPKIWGAVEPVPAAALPGFHLELAEVFDPSFDVPDAWPAEEP